MIVSQTHQFIFFHNPKAGGTSVRATIERFNDIGFGLWGVDAGQTGLTIDRAHLGADEFARLYPDLWSRVRDYRKFCVYRDPVDRFLSSVAEHSKLHGPVDIRFCSAAQRSAVVMAMIDRLEPLGTAEAPQVMNTYELTHFKPQWIYWTNSGAGVPVEAFALNEIAALIGTISQLAGEPVEQKARNRREQLSLPGPLARLAASSTIRRQLGNLPGMGRMKHLLRKAYSTPGKTAQRIELSDREKDRTAAFVQGFYAGDFARWPGSDRKDAPQPLARART